MIRAFLAIDLPGDLKKRLFSFQKLEVPVGLKVKWVEEENLHLTLHFFGNLKEDLLERLGKHLALAFQEFSPFELALSEVGAFPLKGNPRVIWIGLLDPSQSLKGLFQALKKVLKRLKLEVPSENFHPHITLLRVKGVERAEALPKFLEVLKREGERHHGLSFGVREVILFKSELSPRGPKYTPLKTFPLKGGPS